MQLTIKGRSTRIIHLTPEFFKNSEVIQRGKKVLLTPQVKARDIALDVAGQDLVSYELHKGKRLISKYTDPLYKQPEVRNHTFAPKGCKMEPLR